MIATFWSRQAVPSLRRPVLASWRWLLRSPMDLTTSRRRLRRSLDNEPQRLPDGAASEDVERLLLAFEELASNGLRHGRQPVSIEITATRRGWLINVTDTATDLPPTPAVDRDPADGGLGLYLIAELATDFGWSIADGHKNVWACIQPA